MTASPTPSATGALEILVVDDDPQLRTLARRILERHGHSCRLAADASEARHALANARPNLVLCDLRMAGESGLEVLKHVRREFRHLPVVMLSGVGELEVATTALELGAYGWVTKPFDAPQLLIAVANAMIRARLEKRSEAYERDLERAVTERTSELQQTIAQLKCSEERLQYLADHDELTGLFNRRRFHQELARELARARRHGSRGAVLSVDLDNFKPINDTAGHAAGDKVLVSIAGTLTSRVRSSDCAARIGGDEFAVLLPEVSQEGARTAAEDLLAALHECVVTVENKPARITASIGITEYPSQSATASDVLVDADLAMYEAKQAGRDRIVLHSAAEAQAARAAARLTWTQRIGEALERNAFVMHLQPILDLQKQTVRHGELLIRMIGDDGELIAPGAFLPAAERFGMIHAIDRWVVREAVGLIANGSLGADLAASINLSGQSVAGDAGLLELIGTEITRMSIEPSKLIFEVTETAAIANMSQARDFARGLRQLGCELSLDDFGTGFGSFYYLKHLPVDYVKLDREFVHELPHNIVDQHMIHAVVDISHSLGIKTIAEGVSDRETMRLLKQHHVDYVQGFHIGRPSPTTATVLTPSRTRASPAPNTPAQIPMTRPT